MPVFKSVFQLHFNFQGSNYPFGALLWKLLLLIYPFASLYWVNKETKTGEPGVQDATNRVHNGQIYANKFALYIKFLEAIQGFICQMIYFYFLPFALTLLSSLVDSRFVFFFTLIFCRWCLDNVKSFCYYFYNLDEIYSITIFYAFI